MKGATERSFWSKPCSDRSSGCPAIGLRKIEVAIGFPDSRTCLLHQKLQMLNVCMERRSIREGGLPFAMTLNRMRSDSCQEESEDEFYDCANEDEEDRQKNKGKHAPWNKPEGRLARLGATTLVNGDEPLYVPITQEPVPKTEDQLEDDAEVMLKLGPGSELRAQMMSASLLSDMESFKAANPNGKIEDFIRWYSPRDWIVDSGDGTDDDTNVEKGRLSARMLIPGNTWQMVWETAKPVPARRQKRLFDDTKEAEKVMHFFESRSIGQIVKLTLAAIFHTAIVMVKEHSALGVVADSEANSDKLVAVCCKLSRETWTTNAIHARNNSSRKWDSLLQDITHMEFMTMKSKSLIGKLYGTESVLSDEDREMILALMLGREAELKEGSKGVISQRLLTMFTEAKRVNTNEQHIDDEHNVQLSLPNPVEKQFTLRLNGKTVSKGVCGPQFLRAVLAQNEFRLCGAFSQDTTFC